MINQELLHTEIFNLVYYGNGFTHSDVYQMPTVMRRVYIRKLIEAKELEKEQAKPTNKDFVTAPAIKR